MAGIISHIDNALASTRALIAAVSLEQSTRRPYSGTLTRPQYQPATQAAQDARAAVSEVHSLLEPLATSPTLATADLTRDVATLEHGQGQLDVLLDRLAKRSADARPEASSMRVETSSLHDMVRTLDGLFDAFA